MLITLKIWSPVPYVCQIYKVPATDVEALKSPLMGLFEKRRARKFFIYVQDYDEKDPKSHEGLDLSKVTAREIISYVQRILSIWCHLIIVSCVTRFFSVFFLIGSMDLKMIQSTS